MCMFLYSTLIEWFLDKAFELLCGLLSDLQKNVMSLIL